jgi:small-conductance mechanosensitive channel
MNITQINTAILRNSWTNDELNSIIAAVKFSRSTLTKIVKYSLSVGDNVNFKSSKTGRNVTGHVTKIAVKYVTVRTVDGLWKVPANMLNKVEDEHESA